MIFKKPHRVSIPIALGAHPTSRIIPVYLAGSCTRRFQFRPAGKRDSRVSRDCLYTRCRIVVASANVLIQLQSRFERIRATTGALCVRPRNLSPWKHSHVTLSLYATALFKQRGISSEPSLVNNLPTRLFLTFDSPFLSSVAFRWFFVHYVTFSWELNFRFLKLKSYNWQLNCHVWIYLDPCILKFYFIFWSCRVSYCSEDEFLDDI